MWSVRTWDLVTTERWAGDDGHWPQGTSFHGDLKAASSHLERLINIPSRFSKCTFFDRVKEYSVTPIQNLVHFAILTRLKSPEFCSWVRPAIILEVRHWRQERVSRKPGNHDSRQKQFTERSAAVMGLPLSVCSSAGAWPGVAAEWGEWYCAVLQQQSNFWSSSDKEKLTASFDHRHSLYVMFAETFSKLSC